MSEHGHDLLADVSRETSERLELLQDLVEKWSHKINLVSKASLPHIWERHILDSVQIWQLRPSDAKTWMDMGSGGGFPGLVIAALAKQQRPDLKLTMVESDQRKCAFLRTALREMEVAAEVRTERLETLESSPVDVVSARALASLDQLLSYSEPHLTSQTISLFPKGERHEAEIAEAKVHWRFTCDTIPSATHPGAAILKLGEISRV